MRKYGIENFKFTELCITDNKEIAYKLEDFFIREFDTIIDNGNGYNNNYGGLHGLHSELTKEKLKNYNFQNGELNGSYGRTGEESFAGKKIINITKNIRYSTLRECSIFEYGDIKYVKQISKVCDPNSNRFSYMGNRYAFLNDDGTIVGKNTVGIKNVGSVGVKVIERFSGKMFDSIQECAEYFNLSTGVIRDRIYNRIKKDRFKDLYKFEIYN